MAGDFDFNIKQRKVSGSSSNSGNTGQDTQVFGTGNVNNSAGSSLIVGNAVSNNSTGNSLFVGSNIGSNGGGGCFFTGYGHNNNAENQTSFSGWYHQGNTGDYNIYTGARNSFNQGNYNAIFGIGNQGNFGSYSLIAGSPDPAYAYIRIVVDATGSNTGDTINKTSHGLVAGDPIRFTGLSGGAGLNTTTQYYVCTVPNGNTFTVTTAINPLGPPQPITADYSNVQYIAKASNYGDYNVIAGSGNWGITGNYCAIFGQNNYRNTGTHNIIGGSDNRDNSGDYCLIAGRAHDQNSGHYCSISGYYNYANTGDYCIIGGWSHYSNSGDFCLIAGQQHSNNSGDFCLITGLLAENNTLNYARVHGGGTAARIIDLVAKAQTTTATTTTLTLGGAAEDATNRINIPASTTWMFTVKVVGRKTDSTKFQMWERQGLIYRDGANNTTLDGVVGIGADRDVGSLGATLAITADDTNEALKIAVTTIAAETIQWAAQINITQVG